jgi:hypothetical protein
MTNGFSKPPTTNRQQTVTELESPILNGLVRFANEHGSVLIVSWSD